MTKTIATVTMHTCDICGNPIRSNNKTGICRSNEYCAQENTRKQDRDSRKRRLEKWREEDPATAPMTAEQYQESRRRDICKIKGCGRPHAANGLCGSHRRREKLGLPVDVEISRRDKPKAVCSAGDCKRFVEAQGLCPGHYRRWTLGMRGDDLEKPLRAMRRKGSGSISEGYILIRNKEGKWGKEHRLIMEELLGRPLHKYENVHHINGQRDDNTTNGPLDKDFKSGNLELWSTSQPAGQRVADKIAWAKALLAEYGIAGNHAV